MCPPFKVKSQLENVIYPKSGIPGRSLTEFAAPFSFDGDADLSPKVERSEASPCDGFRESFSSGIIAVRPSSNLIT